MTSWKQISMSALAHNVRVLRSHLSPGVKLCLVLKADAYGHGIKNVVRCPLVSQAASLAVADYEEALSLREVATDVRCLLPLDDFARHCPSVLVNEALRSRVIFTVTTPAGLQYLARQARAWGVTPPRLVTPIAFRFARHVHTQKMRNVGKGKDPGPYCITLHSTRPPMVPER